MDDDEGRGAETQKFSLTFDLPGDWPDSLCATRLAMLALESYDLRAFRHHPQVRTSVWAARRAAARSFKDMLAAYRSGNGYSRRSS